MQFANPGMLWGLLALAIPLIIHLFNFRRTKKVYFTNVAFLKKVETETSSFRKLKQWLIMAARMAFIAALVLAFAQPFIPAQNTRSTAESGMNSLYLDNSLSMQNTTESKRYIDLAVLKIDELLGLFKNQQNVQFLTNSFSGEDQFIKGTGKVKDRLTEVGFSGKSRSLAEVQNRQLSMAAKEGAAQHSLFWFSDFQKSTAGDLNALKKDSLTQVYIVPVQGEVQKNVFVDSVWLASPFVREMQNSVLYVKLYNSGNEPVENLPVKLFIDGVQTSTSSVSIAPESSSTASFNFTVRERGQHRGRLQFDDQPVTFDNESFFVIDISPNINILHLYDQKAEGDYVKRLFSNDSLFNYSEYSLRNVDLSRVQTQDFVIVQGMSTPSQNLVTALQEFANNGGHVFVIPGKNASEAVYKDFLGGLGFAQISINARLDSTEAIGLAKPDKNIPFYADVFEQTGDDVLDLPVAKPVLIWSGVGEKLLELRSGQAFLSRSNYSAGKVYLLSTPLDKSNGNFAEHALFVPTLFKMAALSVRPQPLAYRFSDRQIAIPLSNASASGVYALKSGKQEIIPSQRVLNDQLLIEIPDLEDLGETVEAGIFELQKDGVTEKLIALNHNSKESSMAVYSVEELKDIFQSNDQVTVFENVLDGDFISSFAENNFGKQLWKYFLYGALVFLLLEVLLIRLLKS
ncbi:BatA domain-containing protein [Jiulongibacter sp. NS-SX5]|uniref:BatA domain-containing protein n=1 Tax=Jiulongibacter sp. NS-SX5 TaxID=3463854 RepID=UPI004057F401